MEWVLYFAGVILVVCVLSVWAAVKFSAPAPDWYEQEEYYKERYRWYK